jgi:hypothetical protein
LTNIRKNVQLFTEMIGLAIALTMVAGWVLSVAPSAATPLGLSEDSDVSLTEISEISDGAEASGEAAKKSFPPIAPSSPTPPGSVDISATNSLPASMGATFTIEIRVIDSRDR